MPVIVTKRNLNSQVTYLEVDCPAIARKARPGQFVMLRVDRKGERFPLTIADYDDVRGTITVMYQRVGLSTQKLELQYESRRYLAAAWAEAIGSNRSSTYELMVSP